MSKGEIGTTRKVKTCGYRCPFEDSTSEGNFCSLAPFEPPHYAAIKWSQTEPPAWCPLRAGAVTVELDVLPSHEEVAT